MHSEKIKANDLRIENIIAYSTINEPYKVIGLDKDTIDIEGIERQDCNGCYENVMGIPLTEEWLIKLGFKKGKLAFTYNNFENKGDFEIDYNTFTVNLLCEWNGHEEEFYEVKTKIKYVHQLQNLCFALTGEELIYNEK